MTSWRDSASQQSQDDLDGLVDASLPFAQKMLDEHGEFLPYAVAISVDGAIRSFAGDPGGGEHPASTEVLAILVDGLRGDEASLRAVALVSDVRLAESDAIRVEVEHREGPAIAVLLPYRPRDPGPGIDYGGLQAGSGVRHIWGDRG